MTDEQTVYAPRDGPPVTPSTTEPEQFPTYHLRTVAGSGHQDVPRPLAFERADDHPPFWTTRYNICLNGFFSPAGR